MRTRFVTSLALALTLAVAACGGGKTTSTSSSPSTASPASSSPGAGTATSTTSTPARSGSTPASFGYVPLWPFASVAAAEQWQREAVAGGHQPWRLDAGEVAVTFARQYLGFTEINKVIRMRVTANDAHVTVGWTIEGSTGTVAVVHLVRIGSGTGRPWEVVGTDDTATFSLTRPRYGSTVAGTITVGGRIAGVDESIRVTARQLSGVVGGYCCLPAGAAAPWSVRLRLTNPKPGPITIVASTGGHIADVERFTVTGLRSGQ
jgi:hypothetical protein